MPRKVLFVFPVAEKGGAEIAFVNLIEHLPRDRYQPYAAVLGSGPLLEDMARLHVPTLQLPSHRIRAIGMTAALILRLANYVCRKKIDIIQTNGVKAQVYGGLARRLVPWSKVICWHMGYLHGREIIERVAMLVPPDEWVFVSRACQRASLRRSPWLPHSPVIYHSTDNKRFSPEYAGASREALGLTSSDLVVTMVGRLQ